LASSAINEPTPLSIEIDRFIKIITAVALTLGVVFFIFGLIYEYPPITNLVFAIGIIVANVPEGLLATVTVSLALTAQRMATKFVLVKNLESVETLGSTSCICSDKTGTLTQSKMTVSHMYTNRKQFDTSTNFQLHERNQAKGDSKDDKIKIDYDEKDANFMELVKSVVLGTYTIFNYDPTDQEAKQLYARMKKVSVSSLEDEASWKAVPAGERAEMAARLRVAEKTMLWSHRACKGDASETGLVQFCQPLMDLNKTREECPVFKYKTSSGKEVEAIIPFSSDIKFNAFIRDMGPKEGRCVFMKGAPERILVRCNKILVEGKEQEFTQDLRNEVQSANSGFGDLGERVLAFARCRLPTDKYHENYNFDVKNWKSWGLDPNKRPADYENVEGSFPMHDLTLVGIVSLNDPPRVGVDLSIAKCRSAGIKVIMVTGDQPPTAAAIANKVNIIKHPDKEFNHMVNELKMAPEEAWSQCTGIVVHGDLLAEKHLAEESLEEGDPVKG
jgi:sodium/potassium-transporting ATPase subunit alpha